MASNTPSTYDEILRNTVPEVDTSVRPTKAQEQQALEGFRAMDDSETLLFARASDALLGAKLPMGSVQIEIDRDTATLRGQVPDIDAVQRVEELIGEVEGIEHVSNLLVVAAKP